MALAVSSAIQAAQSPKKQYKKQDAKPASRPARQPASRQAAKPKPAAKPVVKTDKELLQDQIKAMSNDWVLNHNRELKNFYYKNLCPVRNWTKQDQIDTAIWVRKAYAIFKKGPDKKGTQMPSPEDFFYTVLEKIFMVSPFYLNATGTQRTILEEDLSLYLRTFVAGNMKTDFKDVKPFPMDKYF